ncbi:MAG TPA: glutaredoxin family protein [Burkholderiales bacterium]|nr:glutaredoxin family protein [Burkholderiales bacterium]
MRKTPPVWIALLCVPLFASQETESAEMYRWVDAEGKVHYSDQPPPPSVKKVEPKKRLSDKQDAPQMPYELQRATKNFPVTLFVTECGAGCTQARQLLAKRGVPYTEIDAADPAALEQLKTLTGGSPVVPVLRIGQQVLKGFEEGQWNAALDTAGYPATALIKVTPERPQPKPAAPATPAAPEPQGEPAPASREGEG